MENGECVAEEATVLPERLDSSVNIISVLLTLSGLWGIGVLAAAVDEVLGSRAGAEATKSLVQKYQMLNLVRPLSRQFVKNLHYEMPLYAVAKLQNDTAVRLECPIFDKSLMENAAFLAGTCIMMLIVSRGNTRAFSIEHEEVMRQLKYRAEGMLRDGHLLEDEEEGDPERVLFVNLMVRSTEKLQKNIIAEKVPNPFGFGVLRGLAGKVLKKALTEDKVATQFADKMPSELPDRMDEMGIRAQCRKMYSRGGFVAIELKIQDVDLPRLLAAKGKDGAAGVVGSCFESCESCKAPVESKVSHVVVRKLIEVLPEKLKENMSNKGLEVDVVCKNDLEQPEYIAHVKEMFEHDASA